MAVSEAMQRTPLQHAKSYCAQCEPLHAVLNDIDNQTKLVQLRSECTKCKRGEFGIYKADAIVTQFYQPKSSGRPKLTPGRKPTRYKTHGKQVKRLYSNGHSQRDIARRLGISRKTVGNILRVLPKVEG